MNILFIASFRITAHLGGVQRVTETLAKEFTDYGYDVCYLSTSKGKKELINEITQYYLPKGADYNDIDNISFFKNLIKKRKINIIINQTGFSTGDIKFIKYNISSAIKILTVHHNCLKCLNDQYHNIYSPTLKSKGLFKIFNNSLGWYVLRKIHKIRYAKIIKETINLSDKVVLLSEKFIPEINFYLPNFKPSKVIGIPNPNPFSNIKATNFDEKENILLYVGRLEYVQKRVDRLIEIWKELYSKFPDWVFHLVGDGSMKNELEKIIKDNDIGNIVLHGFKDPVPFYNKAKVFCLTSEFEGFGMVLVECQTYGVVPVTNKSFTSIDEIIANDKTGIIIDDFNLENYVEKLHLLMKNSEKLQKMSQNAHKYIDKFNSQLIAKCWIEHFEILARND